jgi:bifunctional DNA-binding transcriptional regulator/antitoxin component of YhaV-PrlF toxin-antitoxin module
MNAYEHLTDEEAVDLFDDDTEKVYQAKVTGRHAITLPAELCRALKLVAGDRVEFKLKYGTVTMRKAGGPPPLEARGILRDHRYESMEAMIRDLRDGRGTWTTEDEAEYQRNLRSRPAAPSSE